MYFEKELDSLKKINEKNSAATKEHTEKIRAVSEKLQELAIASDQALKEGNADAYIKLGGDIAVAEAELKMLEQKSTTILPQEEMDSIRNDICTKYEQEVGKRITKIFKLCEDMLKQMADIETIFDDMSTVANMYEAIAGRSERVFYNEDMGDIRNMSQYLESVIDMAAENGNSRSIRGYAYRLNYDACKINK